MKTFLLFAIALFTTISTFAQVPTNGLMTYYPFNGNANDAKIMQIVTKYLLMI